MSCTCTCLGFSIQEVNPYKELEQELKLGFIYMYQLSHS